MQGKIPQNMTKTMVLTYLHVLDPGDLPWIKGGTMENLDLTLVDE